MRYLSYVITSTSLRFGHSSISKVISSVFFFFFLPPLSFFLYVQNINNFPMSIKWRGNLDLPCVRRQPSCSLPPFPFLSLSLFFLSFLFLLAYFSTLFLSLQPSLFFLFPFFLPSLSLFYFSPLFLSLQSFLLFLFLLFSSLLPCYAMETAFCSASLRDLILCGVFKSFPVRSDSMLRDQRIFSVIKFFPLRSDPFISVPILSRHNSILFHELKFFPTRSNPFLCNHFLPFVARSSPM